MVHEQCSCCASTRDMSVGCVLFVATCLLAYITAVDAAALNKTALLPANLILPVNRLQSVDSKQDEHGVRQDSLHLRNSSQIQESPPMLKDADDKKPSRLQREESLHQPSPLIFAQGLGNAGRMEMAGNVQPTIKPSPQPYIVPLKLYEVQPPEHIDGLRMEQDGHLNHDYKKEIIIGNHEEFEQAGSDKKLVARLKIIFIKADKNHDGFLDRSELKSWIMNKVQEHLTEAAEENAKIFHHLDTNSDGFVTWKEFHVHFLLAKGYNQNDTLQHVDDYESLSIEPEERERLIRYKFRWAEADEEPQDNQLNITEMQNFRHPEQSAKMIIRMAKDIIDNLDHDEDGIITKEEFVALPRGDVDDMMHGEDTDQVWLNERLKEFENVIDLDHDGKVGLDELKVYVDPHNENHAHLEADNLIQLATRMPTANCQ